MERTLIAALPKAVGESVCISGWVSARRDHGKLAFLEIRDRTGTVQAVFLAEHLPLLNAGSGIRPESIVTLSGLVKARPGKEAPETPKDVEIEAQSLDLLSGPAVDLPIDISQKEMGLQLDTLLNYRTLALRNERVRSIFVLYDALLEGYDAVCRQRGFTEIKTPKILEAATEGGANFFKINYFDREAFLAQSPQFYKQAGMSVFERVFEIGPVFRAEPHFTTRHVNEYTGLDAEMGFIESVDDVMAELETVMQALFAHVGTHAAGALEAYGASAPQAVPIPRIRLESALKILKERYGKEVEGMDIDSEGERLIGEYAREEHGSDLVFLTHYPTSLRPFYSMPSPDDPETTETFDLIFRGLEIASGGQRIHDPAMLEASIRNRGLDPAAFKDYLDIFRFGAPAHGGWGLGSERIVQKLLGLGSIKEAVLYPRDVKRLAP